MIKPKIEAIAYINEDGEIFIRVDMIEQLKEELEKYDDQDDAI